MFLVENVYIFIKPFIILIGNILVIHTCLHLVSDIVTRNSIVIKQTYAY